MAECLHAFRIAAGVEDDLQQPRERIVLYHDDMAASGV